MSKLWDYVKSKADDCYVTFTKKEDITVAGNKIPTYVYTPPTAGGSTSKSVGAAYFPEGIVMGGSAASAGLVTRGICGVSTPDETTGGCNKHNLYLNYDENNNWNVKAGSNDTETTPSRAVVINAGSVGSDLTGEGDLRMFSYCAVRGDVVKDYCDRKHLKKYEDDSTAYSITSTASFVSRKFAFLNGSDDRAIQKAYYQYNVDDDCMELVFIN